MAREPTPRVFGDSRRIFDEGLAGATRFATPEPADVQMHNLAIGQRQVGDAAPVAAKRMLPSSSRILSTTRPMPTGERTGAPRRHRTVPARQRARRQSATTPADPPSTPWVAQRVAARPAWFTGS